MSDYLLAAFGVIDMPTLWAIRDARRRGLRYAPERRTSGPVLTVLYVAAICTFGVLVAFVLWTLA